MSNKKGRGLDGGYLGVKDKVRLKRKIGCLRFNFCFCVILLLFLNKI